MVDTSEMGSFYILNEDKNNIQSSSSSIVTQQNLWKKLSPIVTNKDTWHAYGNTIVSEENDYIKLEVGNKQSVAYLYLDTINPTKFKDGEYYTISFSAFSNEFVKNAFINIKNFSSFTDKHFKITNQKKTYTVKLAKNKFDKQAYINFSNFPEGSIIYISKNINISLKQPVLHYPQPIGFPWKGATILMDDPDQEKDIKLMLNDLAEAGVKHIRLHINPSFIIRKFSFTKNEFLAYTENRIKKIYIPLIKQYGMDMWLGMEDMPYDTKVCESKRNKGFWDNPICIQNFRDTAEYMAKAFTGISSNTITAYQFMSEPVSIDENGQQKLPENWYDLSEELINIVRQYDKEKFIVWSSSMWAFPYYNKTVPFDDDKVIYNFHMFEPQRYTHQGVIGYPMGVTYNANNRIEQQIKTMTSFRDKNNNIPILIGSYAISCWIPDRVLWLKDLHSLLIKNKIGAFNMNIASKYKGWDLRYTVPDGWDGKKMPKYVLNKQNPAWKELSSFFKSK
jgi:hypothetical protein